MYSLRDVCKDNYEQALAFAAECGYQGVEFAGFFDIPAEEMKALLEKYHLIAMGSHTAWDIVENDFDQMVAYNKTIGNNRIICPWYDMNSEAEVKEFAKKVAVYAPKLKEAGMTLYYHNHAHEFGTDNGKYLMDLLGENTTPDDLKFELDVYWVYRGGVNPVRYMKKYADRLDIFHIKDGDKFDGTPVGSGEVDIDGVLAFAKQHQMDWAVVEAESGTTPERQMKDVSLSAEYLKDKIN
jgi:sugar phosphate isomerase/epimerase